MKTEVSKPCSATRVKDAFLTHAVMRFAVVVVSLASLHSAVAQSFSDANWISMGGFPGVNGKVYAAVVDGSGNLYIGGDFTIVGDVVANGIAKWNGSDWSPLGSGVSFGGGPFSVRALAVSGSDVYAGGEFLTAGGVPANFIAKWNGSSWSALGSGIGGGGGGTSPSVFALAVSGSDLYAGGAFTTAGGNPANFVAKWNGSSWSALGSGMNNWVYALAVSGGDLYVGGLFTAAGGASAVRVAKWNGSAWSALGSGICLGVAFCIGAVNALAVSGSELYAGGEFNLAGGSPANGIARWNGSSWSALGSEVQGTVYALTVSGNDLYAGGVMGSTFGSDSIAKWNGSSWSGLGSGIGPAPPYVYALGVSGSAVYAGGYFQAAGGVLANSIAKWNGSSWSALTSGMNGGVRVLAASGGNLYAGGSFTTVGGITASNVAKWDGSSWSALGSGMNEEVIALAVGGTNLYAGGYFTTAGGSAANYIAKWNGSSWSALGTGIGGSDPGGFGPFVFALAVSGNDLYAGGRFTTAGGVPVNHIAKWNGSSWSALGSGMSNAGVNALAVAGSYLYAGGSFTTAGGVSANAIAKWNGSSWSALGSGLGYDCVDPPCSASVYALAVSGSDVYAGGGVFTAAGGGAATNIAKWDASSWSALGSGIVLYNGPPYSSYFSISRVSALAVLGSDLYVGGWFTTAGGKVSAYIARAYLPALPALSVSRSGPEVTVSWPSLDTTGFTLEQTGALSAPPSWVTNTTSVTNDGTNKSVTLPATNSPQFFRLRRP